MSTPSVEILIKCAVCVFFSKELSDLQKHYWPDGLSNACDGPAIGKPPSLHTPKTTYNGNDVPYQMGDFSVILLKL